MYPIVALVSLVCQGDWGFRNGKIRLGMSPKDSRINFRVRSQLKEKLESIAASEGRSVAQICDALLQAGLVVYEKEGAKCISRFLGFRGALPRDRVK